MSNPKHRKENTNRNILIAVTAILLVIIIILLLHSCDVFGRNDPEPEVREPVNSGIAYDSAAVSGGWDEADYDSIVSGLNEKVEEGMINISMNTSPFFLNGASEGNLMIVNESVNRYPQVVEIVRNDTNQQVYKSGAIPVGSKIETAKLNTVLSAGKYECTALFYNVNPETGEYLGCAGAIIEITVLE